MLITRYAVTFTFFLLSISTCFADGSWIISKEGARLWNPNPQPNETCSWTGSKDSLGYATGKGLTIWYVNGKAKQVCSETLSRGRSISTSIILEASGQAHGWSPTGTAYSVKLVPESNSTNSATQHASRYRPTESSMRAQSPSQRELKESIDTIKSGVELYNEIKKARPKKDSADLIIHSVSVSSSKSNGKSWDGGNGKPDLKVSISKGFADSHTTNAGSNSTYASFNNEKLRVSEGDTITIKVYDQDAFADDLVGSYTKKITALTLRQGRVTWSFDQVTALVVEFEL
ncbi:hypothetical protein Pan110_53580 [Gimesia panareensis]|nr:hypothetical protein Pan110_53580 [Gimesia panareensis]